MANRVYSVCKQIRVTPKEAKLLAKSAKERGLSEAAYMRLLIGAKPNDYPEIRLLLSELINEVNRIGVNINQIVYRYHTDLYSPEDRRRLMAYLQKLSEQLDEVVKRIGDY